MEMQFTEKEFKFVRMLAIGRHFYKDIVVPDRDMARWNNTQYEADIIGVMGEYAVAKYLQIPFDTSINLNGDGGEVDMYFKDFDIQVKATKYENGRLVFNTKEEIVCSVYILVVCDMEALTNKIVGVISKKNVIKHMYEENLGFGVRYCIDQSKLSNISVLKNYK